VKNDKETYKILKVKNEKWRIRKFMFKF
jgi:hypothetical protein